MTAAGRSLAKPVYSFPFQTLTLATLAVSGSCAHYLILFVAAADWLIYISVVFIDVVCAWIYINCNLCTKRVSPQIRTSLMWTGIIVTFISTVNGFCVNFSLFYDYVWSLGSDTVSTKKNARPLT
jgi:hypothetical protein